jgi:uncharacterized pyridoxal phosphate-containing UPF0001 family protein
MPIERKLQQIQQQISQACARGNRSIKDVHIVAVTKSVTVERTQEAILADSTILVKIVRKVCWPNKLKLKRP